MEDYNPNNYSQDLNGFNNAPHRQFNSFNNGQKPVWAAISSFVISILNCVFCCCFTYVAAPVSLAFGIISLAKKWRGTAFAVSGVVISAFTLIFMVISQVMFGSMSRDISSIMFNSSQYAEEYRETGEIPEEFVKYNDEKYDRYWEIFGYDDFEDFFSDMMKDRDTYSDADLIGDDDFITDYDFYDGDFDNDDLIDDDDFITYDDFYDGDFDDFGEKPIDL